MLGNHYHGVMHTYFGLAFFKVFGFSVFSLRIAHAIFGFGILLISHQLLTRATGSRVFPLLVIGVLALDPAFIFAFRTQSYITLSPLFFLLLSLYSLLLIRPGNGVFSRSGAQRGLLIVSGFLGGWAFYGYFIYIFFVPAFIVIVVHLSRGLGHSTLKMSLYWLTGFLLGTFLYFIGYGMLWSELGGLDEILKSASGLRIEGNSIEWHDRPYLLFQHVVASIAGNYQYSVIFNQAAPVAYGVVKSMTMLFVIMVAVPLAAVRRQFDASLGYVLLLIASYLVILLGLASRIAPHHTIPLLPLLYIFMGISLYRAGFGLLRGVTGFPRKITRAAFALAVLFLVVLNLEHQNVFQEQLVETGGVKYYSDSLTLLAEEARHDPDPPYYVFGEWGFTGAFVFLTEGKIPYASSMDEWAIGLVPCSDDLYILFWGLSNPTVESFADTQGRVLTRKVYYQRDGVVSFTALGITERTNCSLTDTYPSY